MSDEVGSNRYSVGRCWCGISVYVLQRGKSWTQVAQEAGNYSSYRMGTFPVLLAWAVVDVHCVRAFA